ALHGGLARRDEALDARDDAHAADDARPGRLALDVVAREGRDLEEGAVAIEEELDPLPREQLAALEVAPVVLLAASLVRGRLGLRHLLEDAEVLLAVLREVRRAGVDARSEHGIALLDGHARHPRQGSPRLQPRNEWRFSVGRGRRAEADDRTRAAPPRAAARDGGARSRRRISR